MATMHLASGFCRHWLIIVHCCASLRSQGACDVRVWVSGSGAGAAQPVLLQCSSAFHWLTLQLRLCSPTKTLALDGEGREGTAAQTETGPKKEKRAGKERDGVSQSAYAWSNPPYFSSYTTVRSCCRFVFLSHLKFLLCEKSQTPTRQPLLTLSFLFTLRQHSITPFWVFNTGV